MKRNKTANSAEGDAANFQETTVILSILTNTLRANGVDPDQTTPEG